MNVTRLEKVSSFGDIFTVDITGPGIKPSLLTEHVSYYKYKPGTILHNERDMLCWNMGIMTEKTRGYNRPDIIYALIRHQMKHVQARNLCPS